MDIFLLLPSCGWCVNQFREKILLLNFLEFVGNGIGMPV